VRVLHIVATDKRRGAEQFAADLVRALDSPEIDQRVAILRSGGTASIRYDAPISLSGSARRPIGGLGADLGTLRALRRTVVEWRPQIVQAHGGDAQKLAELACLGGTGARVVYRRIGTAPPWVTRGPRRFLQRVLIRRAERVVAVSEAVRLEAIRMFGVPASDVVTIPNAVDHQRLEPSRSSAATRSLLGIAASARVLLSMGALTWEKDPITHIDVGARVLRQVPSAVHVIAGDGPLRSAVEGEIRRLGLNERTMLLGERDDVADILAASDVMLFASRPDGMEGMPAVIIEAGMAGVPVVAYAVSGVSEVLVDGVTGQLVRWGDRPALASGAIDALSHSEGLSAMGVAARRRCSEYFDITAVAPQYQRLYEEISNT
jgi:glycosyltransferase involved in cell wall biosynthesis